MPMPTTSINLGKSLNISIPPSQDVRTSPLVDDSVLLKTDNGLGIEQVPVVGIAGYALALRGLRDRAKARG